MRVTLSQAFERIPLNSVSAGGPVNGEVALEHAALHTETVDTGLVVGSHGLRQLDRTRRRIALMPAKTAHGHCEPTQFDDDVCALRELGDVLPP